YQHQFEFCAELANIRALGFADNSVELLIEGMGTIDHQSDLSIFSEYVEEDRTIDLALEDREFCVVIRVCCCPSSQKRIARGRFLELFFLARTRDRQRTQISIFG